MYLEECVHISFPFVFFLNDPCLMIGNENVFILKELKACKEEIQNQRKEILNYQTKLSI